jgi:hypothetical protein
MLSALATEWDDSPEAWVIRGVMAAVVLLVGLCFTHPCRRWFRTHKERIGQIVLYGTGAAFFAAIGVGVVQDWLTEDEPTRPPIQYDPVFDDADRHYENLREVPTPDPAFGDLDCADIGFEHFVGSDDPHHLDADGDGVACEGW